MWSPLLSGARGAAASFSGFILLWPAALPGIIRPGIQARQPYSGCGSRPDRRSGSSGSMVSLYAPFLDPRGHQRACMGKRSVSRVEAPSAFNRSGDETLNRGPDSLWSLKIPWHFSKRVGVCNPGVLAKFPPLASDHHGLLIIPIHLIGSMTLSPLHL